MQRVLWRLIESAARHSRFAKASRSDYPEKLSKLAWLNEPNVLPPRSLYVSFPGPPKKFAAPAIVTFWTEIESAP